VAGILPEFDGAVSQRLPPAEKPSARLDFQGLADKSMAVRQTIARACV
jgi:hypothetical protein